MMKVLLYISPESDRLNINQQLVTQLANSLNATIETIIVHSYDEAMKHLDEYQVVHVFGCWNHGVANTLLKADKHNIPTVFTPLGGLQPWILRRHHLEPQLRLQRQMTNKAGAVHLCGKLEYDTFSTLGWNHRVEIIKNPILTSLLTIDDMAEQMLKLYQKVIDSMARRLLTPQEERFIGQLVQIGIDTNVLLLHDYCEKLKKDLSSLDETSWRRIFIYCYDERVLKDVKAALQNLKVPVPDILVENIDRFRTGKKYNEGSLRSDELLSRNVILKNKLNDIVQEEETVERKLCIQIANIKYELEHHNAPLSHLADIYHTLRFEDMDEVRVAEIFHYFGIEDFAQRLMAVEQEVLHITEGFIPIKIKKDKRSDTIRRAITKFIH
jgi:hypothetical protein